MSTLALTHQTSLNNVPLQTTLDEQGKALIFAWKTLMLANGWTVDGSCDSVANGIDAVDRWASAANLVWAAAGVAHSWIVLHHPTRSQRLLIDLSTGATSQHQTTQIWSSSSFSGGSNTAAPTTTAGNSQTFTNKPHALTPVAPVHYHTERVGTTGEFMFNVSADGSGRFMTTFGLRHSSLFETGDDHPVIALACFNNATRGGLTVANTQSATHAIMWNDDGTRTTGNFGVSQIIDAGATGISALQQSSGSSISGQFMMLPAILWTGTGTVSPRGQLVDVKIAPSQSTVSVGTEEPLSPATSTTCIVGEFWVPNGGVTPSL
jgi:hypothetical protein